MTHVGRAVEKGEPLGFIKVVADADTRRILGAAILGISGDEAIHGVLDMMNADPIIETLRWAVPLHPTVSEVIPTLLLGFAGDEATEAAWETCGSSEGGAATQTAAIPIQVQDAEFAIAPSASEVDRCHSRSSTMNAPHLSIEPSILYLGTPVVLISTQNEDGTANLAPMSSAWWLGWRCMLGLQTASKTPQNMIRTGECVLNLTSAAQADAVDRLARLTGTKEIPALKQQLGYSYEPGKFEIAGMTPVASETVAAPRALECPIQLEAVVAARHGIMDDDPAVAGLISAFEVRITRVHVHPSLIMDGHPNRIDPAKWQPLIMNFQKLYSVSSSEVVPSRLAEIEEHKYRMPDVDRARDETLMVAA